MRDYATMPKVELHLHLEGAIPLPAMWELVQRHGGDPVTPDIETLRERFTYRNFAHFIDTWVWKNRFIRTHEDFAFLATAVTRELARRRVVYAEAFFSPTDFSHTGLPPQDIALALREGIDRVDRVEIRLIVDLVRDTGPQRAAATFAAIDEVAAAAGIVGIGIGGSEAEFPPELFVNTYARAAELGYRRTAHAGEGAGPASVWGALRTLGAERIGHGVRSVEDPELVAWLVETQTPLEVCPTSNIATGVVAEWEDHPLRGLVEAGAVVTINTDDPAMFHTTLAQEYALVQGRFGFDDAVMARLAHNAVQASWAAPPLKAALAADLKRWWD